MQFSIARLLIVTTIAALFLAVIRAIELVAWLSLVIGVTLTAISWATFPLAVLCSRQRGTQLNVRSNRSLRFISFLAAVGALCLCLFALYAVAVLPYRFL